MKHHVESGAIEIVSGGWVMHDEAAPYFVDMIDQVIALNWDSTVCVFAGTGDRTFRNYSQCSHKPEHKMCLSATSNDSG